MIIANVIGGLGNQMFQYAAARALANRKDVPLKIDISEFASYSLHHGFELSRVFNCSIDFAQANDVRRLLGWQASKKIRKLIARFNLKSFNHKSLVLEPHFNYWAGINELHDDCYLKGYWQSEKYFADYAAVIRKDFAFRQPLNNKNEELASLMSQVNAVSLHVRRGDYINNSVNLTKHGICSAEYYQAAIELITERVEEPFFFVFSDDIEWVKKNIIFKKPSKFIEHNTGPESFNDMHLMSLCTHHIIANSSFSWWGAWLAQSPEQIVVAPEPWFDDFSINTEDLLPKKWIKILKKSKDAFCFTN